MCIRDRLLSEENKRQFFIPRGFAHGFAVLSEEAVFTYKVDKMCIRDRDRNERESVNIPTKRLKRPSTDKAFICFSIPSF